MWSMRWLLLFGAGLCALAAPTVAEAQQSDAGRSGFGLRAGFGLDPDQFVIGGQFAIRQPNSVFRIVPSVDLGFGSDVTTILFNGDFLGRLKLEGSNFGFYGGAGLGIAYIDPQGSDGKFKAGLNLIVGAGIPLGKGRAGSLEARFGIGDIPDFRLLAILEI